MQTGGCWPPPPQPGEEADAEKGGGAAAALSRLQRLLRGVPGLYAGVAGSLASHVPASAVFFAVYETSKVRVGAWRGGVNYRASSL
jgi:hypothetical protein